jgi:hypothetical protein
MTFCIRELWLVESVVRLLLIITRRQVVEPRTARESKVFVVVS